MILCRHTSQTVQPLGNNSFDSNHLGDILAFRLIFESIGRLSYFCVQTLARSGDLIHYRPTCKAVVTLVHDRRALLNY